MMAVYQAKPLENSQKKKAIFGPFVQGSKKGRFLLTGKKWSPLIWGICSYDKFLLGPSRGAKLSPYSW